jgi:hypothetical protein
MINPKLAILDEPTSALDSLTEKSLFQSLPALQIGEHRLFYRGNVVYENQDVKESLAFVFFKDGIRELQFSRGLEFRELLDVLNIVRKSDFLNRMEDDLVTVLPAILHAPGFELRTGRQDDIRKTSGWGKEVILDEEEFHLVLIAQDLRRRRSAACARARPWTARSRHNLPVNSRVSRAEVQPMLTTSWLLALVGMVWIDAGAAARFSNRRWRTGGSSTG